MAIYGINGLKLFNKFNIFIKYFLYFLSCIVFYTNYPKFILDDGSQKHIDDVLGYQTTL